MIRLGLDVGGTFADLAVYDTEQESFSQYKSLTTPDTADCAASCLQKAAEGHGLTLQEFLAKVDLFCFGSTHALNTVLTDRGSRVGILTTKGHRDSYFIAEMDRGGYHDIREASERTFVPLVERELVAEVSERIDFAGRVVVPLYEDEVRAKITALVEAGMEALVIGFLWSHRYPQHELRVAEIAREMYPELHVTAGSEITGTLGEFTRLTTAVINGYIGQRVEQQAASLEKFLRENGLAVPILVMQLLGGVAPLPEVVRRPVMLLKSGPAGGTVAAATVGAQLDLPNVVCLDMGGTSLDVSRIVDGEMQLNRGFAVRKHPIAVPGVEVASIGSGGGSIAVVEQAGSLARLRVGPESASSVPGPASYGRGGEEATVTDANLILGILNPEISLGGEIPLDLEKATEVLDEKVAGPTGQSVVEAAWGIYQVVTAQMADAVEDSLISNGLDPRRFALVSAGAAGSAHATAIASRLGIQKVVIPSFSPIFSAYGLMTTDIRHVYQSTDNTVRIELDGIADADFAKEAAYVSEKLRATAAHPLGLLEEESIAPENRSVSMFIDMRYSGQELNLEVEVPFATVEAGLDSEAFRAILDSWTSKYKRVYGEGAVWNEGAIELTNYRAVAVGRIPSPELKIDLDVARYEPEPSGERRIYLGEWFDAKTYSDSSLEAGAAITGPAIVEGNLMTTLIRPEEEAVVDPYGNLIVNLTPSRVHESSAISSSASTMVVS